MQTTAIFVDVQNIYYTTKQTFNCHFDYNKFWQMISQDYLIKHAFAYAIDRQNEKQRQFQNILSAIGFTVRLKPFIQRRDGSAKGDWDVGITLDVIEFAAHCDRVVLVSGDGDFDLLVKTVKDKFNIPVDVYGVAALSANSLIAAASKFVPIEGELLLSK